MRTKVWSLLVTFVLLFACVTGALMLNAQAAEGTTYQWVVNGEATDTTGEPNEWTFVSIDAAIQYAKSQTAFTWGKDDQLIVHIADDNATAANATGRKLFNVNSIFRADHTLLPITIDGDDPATPEVERNGFALNGTGYTHTNNSYYGIACTNSYYFKGMDLNWGASAIAFRSGCGQVTFDGVTFGGTSMTLSADATSSAVFPGWKDNNFNAMKNSEGYYEISLTLKNLTYSTDVTNAVCARNWSGGFTVNLGSSSLTAAQTRSKLVIGTGATVKNVSIVGSSVSSGVVSNAYCLSMEGGTVTTVYGVRGSSEVYGNIMTEISSGSVANFYPGPNLGKLHGNVTNTVTDGSVNGHFRGGGAATGTQNGNITNYIYGGSLKDVRFGSENGTINGNVTNYLGNKAKNMKFTTTGFAGGNATGGAINGTITNYFDYVKVTGTFYGGPRMGLAEYVVNHFSDGYDGDGVVNVFCGGNSASNGGAIKYSITNNINGGKFGSYLHCGSLSTAWATLDENEKPAYRIINNVAGGSFLRLCCASNGAGIDTAVKNTFTGNISVAVALYGGYGDDKDSAGKTVNAIENSFAANFTGAGGVYGGSMNGAVGTITNTFSGGSFANTVYAGSKAGTVKSIANTVKGGTFGGTYFYGGNENATFEVATSDTAETVRIKNDIEGGSFLRIVGGSSAAKIDGSVVNNVSTDITIGAMNAQSTAFTGGAFYGGNANSGEITGTVTNTFNGTQEGKTVATVPVIYGGNNNSTGSIGKIVNKLESGVFCAFYGGNNYGGDSPIENTVTGGVFVDDSINTLDGQTNYFCGGNRVADMTERVKTTITGGTLRNVYAGTLQGNDSGTVELDLLPVATNLTVLGKAYGITGATSNGANPICIGRDSYLSFAVSDPENYVYVLQTEGWDFDCYVSIPGNENDIGYNQAEGVAPAALYVDYLTDRVILRCGKLGVAENVSLILTDRIAIKVYFAKGSVLEGFTYSFTNLRGEVLASGTEADLTEDGDYYYVVLPAIGLSEFDKPFLLSGNNLRTVDLSIVDLADLGASVYGETDTKAANLFRSIADLGRAANGGETEYNLTVETVNYTPTEPSKKENTDALEVHTMALMMSNAVGISFRGDAAASDTAISVLVNGQDVTQYCAITVSQKANTEGRFDVSVDMYLNVSSMSKEIKIELKNADGSLGYLTMYTRVDYLAQTIASQVPEKKDLAEDLLAYIQAVGAYVA